MDEGERRKICELIETMIAADGRVTEEEITFVRRITERFGLPMQERTTLPPESAVGQATTTLRSLPPEIRGKVMALLVDAAVVDGVVAPEERALLVASAAALGICATEVESRLALRKSTRPEVPSLVPSVTKS